MNKSEEIPLFPLRTVLFPGGVLPLRIFEARYLDMIGECMSAAKGFGICAIRSGAEVGRAAACCAVGTVASVEDFDKAVSFWKQALKADSELSDAHFNIAVALEKQGDIKTAKKHYGLYIDTCENPDEARSVEAHLAEIEG